MYVPGQTTQVSSVVREITKQAEQALAQQALRRWVSYGLLGWAVLVEHDQRRREIGRGLKSMRLPDGTPLRQHVRVDIEVIRPTEEVLRELA